MTIGIAPNVKGPAQPMRTVIYARKSTESSDRQVQSIDDQLSAMRRIAEREGIVVSEELTETKSAKAPGVRPVFAKLMKDVEAGRVTGLLTWSISRLARNPVDGGQVSYQLQTGKLAFIRTADRTYSPEDSSLLLAIENGVATQDIQILRKGVLRGMRGKVERGGLPGPAPLGYLNNRLDKTVEPDPELFPVVRRAWDLLISGSCSLADVHRQLLSWNVSSGRWRPNIARSYMHKLFTNPFYCGQIRYQGELFPGKHLPMVSPEEFADVQRVLNHRADPRPSRHIFPYTGFIRHTCGCLVTAERKIKHYPKTGNTATYTYYHCSGSLGCRKGSVSEEFLTEEILNCFDSIHIDPEQAAWCLEVCRERLPIEVSAGDDHIQALKRQERIVSGKLQQLLDMRLAGELDVEEYQRAKDTAKGQLAAIGAQHDAASQRHERGLALLKEKLHIACLDRGRFLMADPAFKRSCAIGLSKNYLLTLEESGPTLSIEIDPVFRLFAAFEPLRDGSEKPKQGQSLTSDSLWCSFIYQLRTTVQSVVAEEAADSVPEVSSSCRSNGFNDRPTA